MLFRSEMFRVLKPGGFAFVRTPAFEWLRSSHDADLDTYHRFTVPELSSMLQAAGLEIRLSTYANALLFPVVLLRRGLKHLGIGGGSDVKPLPTALGWVNPLFRTILGLEAPLLRAGVRFPFGLSAIVYARKPS